MREGETLTAAAVARSAVRGSKSWEKRISCCVVLLCLLSFDVRVIGRLQKGVSLISVDKSFARSETNVLGVLGWKGQEK